MAKVYIVGGIANDAFKDMFKTIKEVDIIGTFTTVAQLTDEVIEKGVSFLHLAKAVLILDYGFSRDNHVDRAKEFVLLQDALNSSSLSGTKLYLATKDSNLYTLLQKNDIGLPSIIYMHTEVLMLRGEYIPKILNDILQGRHDLTGLYHPEVTRANKVSRMEDDRDTFISESKTINQEILHYGKDEPISPFSQHDFVDSPYSESQARKREQDTKKQERLDNVRAKQASSRPKQEAVQINITGKAFNEPSVQVQVKQNHKKAHETFPEEMIAKPVANLSKFNLDLMKESFQARTQHTILSDKLTQDSGILFFTGVAKSGTSGVLANVADIYALAKRKVLIIDLDVEGRMQPSYFPQYQEQIDNYEGVANSLLQVVKGGAIPTNAVQITSRISMLGLSPQEVIDFNWSQTVTDRLYDVLLEAQALYDMVLVDVPLYLIPACNDSIELANKFIWTTTNKFYDINTLIDRQLLAIQSQLDPVNFVDMLTKSAIWVNLFDASYTDRAGYVVNKVWVRNRLRKLGYPHDLIHTLGETPVYTEWESQFYKGTRYIWQDRTALGVFQQLLTKVVW